MLRIMLVLGLLVLVPAAIVFWRTRDSSHLDPSMMDRARTFPSKSIGTSTVSHAGQPPALPPSGRDYPLSKSGDRTE